MQLSKFNNISLYTKNAIICIGALLAFFSIGCHAAADQNGDNSPEAGDELPADFVQFFDRFHADSTYQLAHIIFPLLGIPGQADTLADPKSYRWQKENWSLHRPFNSSNGTFQRSSNLLMPMLFRSNSLTSGHWSRSNNHPAGRD